MLKPSIPNKKMKRGHLFILLLCMLCADLLSQTQNHDFADIIRNPEKSIQRYKKRLENKEQADSLKNDLTYKLAVSYYQKGLYKPDRIHLSKGKRRYFEAAKKLFEQLETKKGYQINSLFRKGLCDIGLYQFDSAYRSFSKLITFNPLIPEAYYFKAMSYEFSYSKKDTAAYYRLIEEMNAMILVTSDTVSLVRLARATDNLQQFFPCRVFDNYSYPKIADFIGIHPRTYALEVSGGLYDLDTILMPVLNKSLYDIWAKVKLFYWDFTTQMYQEKIMAYEDFMQAKDIRSVLEIPDSIGVQSFELSTLKELHGMWDKKDEVYSHNYKKTEVSCSSIYVCPAFLEVIKGLTYLDKIFIDSIKTGDLEAGFISSARGSILLDTRPPRYFKNKVMESKVVLKDQFNGTSTQSELIARPYLEIKDNEQQWKIIDYELTCLIRGQIYKCSVKNKEFPVEAIALLYKLQKGSMVCVDYIKAVNKRNDTCYLNSISIKIKPEPKYLFSFLDSSLTQGQQCFTHNILFNKHAIKQESYPLLDSLVFFLKRNRDITLEIGANGLLKGEEFSSEQSTQKRAESIADYFAEKGISKARLIPRGYGDKKKRISEQQIDRAKTEKEKQALQALNFYVTFKVLEERVDKKQILLEETLDDLTQKMDTNPKDTNLYNHRGLIRIKLEDYRGAIEDYTRAIELKPCDTSYVRRGYCNYMLDSVQDALRDYKQATALNPMYVIAHNNIGVYYADLGNYTEAVKEYNIAIGYSPQDTLLYYNRAFSKEGLNDFEGAIQDDDKAIELGAKDADVYTNRKRVEIKLFNKRRAFFYIWLILTGNG